MTFALEFDDRPGPTRDAVVATLREWVDALTKACRMAIDEGHFRRDLAVDGTVFEAYGIVLAYNHFHRTLGLDGEPILDRSSRSGHGHQPGDLGRAGARHAAAPCGADALSHCRGPTAIRSGADEVVGEMLKAEAEPDPDRAEGHKQAVEVEPEQREANEPAEDPDRVAGDLRGGVLHPLVDPSLSHEVADKPAANR